MMVPCWDNSVSTFYFHYCMSGAAINNVLSNGNHTNDNNTSIPSSFLSVVAVTVAVALPWVQCVYAISIACRPCATNYVRIMYTNDNNTSTPSSSLSAGAVAVANPPLMRHKYST